MKDCVTNEEWFEAEDLKQKALELYQQGVTPADIFIQTGVCLLIEKEKTDVFHRNSTQIFNDAVFV